MNGVPLANRLLGSKDAARYLCISPRTLWTLQNCGTIPNVRIGRKVLFDRVDLDAWIEAQKSVRR